MANMKLSAIATQLLANNAACVTAIAGGIVTSDVVALAAVLNVLAVSQDISIPLLGQASTPATGPTMLTPA